MKFLTYNPHQAYLVPPSMKDVLGENRLCFFVHRVDATALLAYSA